MIDGHLTDEQLSSQLDGPSDNDRDESAGQQASEHLADCARCRQRLATFEAARQLVRTPVPPLDPEVRAASIASVLRSARDAHVDPRVRVRTTDSPIPMRARRRPQVLVGSAAALVLAVAVGIPLALSSRGVSTGSAASSSASPSTTGASAGAAGSAGPERLGDQHQQSSGANGLSGNGNTAPTNLGVLTSVTALRSRLTGLLSADRAASPSAAGPAGVAATPTPTGAPTTGQAAVTTTTAMPTTETTGKASTGSTSQGSYNVEPILGTSGPFQHCFSSAMRAAGAKRELELLATSEFRGTAALVYVFLPVAGGSSTGNSAHSMAVVTARDGCRVLDTTAL